MVTNDNNSNALTVYDKMADRDAAGAVKTLGLTVASSGMFGSLSPAQGEILALECMVQRLPPMQLALRYHIISNKLSMKADAMLAEFIEQGGKHKIIHRTAEKAEVQLTYEGESATFSFSLEEAKQEPFFYTGKQSDILKAIASGNTSKLEVNPNYATSRKRMQMLWARVVSDGVRTMMPGVNFGRYTPEELGDDGEGEAAPVTSAAAPSKRNGKPKPTIDEVAAEQAKQQQAQQVQQPSDSNVIDAEFEPAGSTAPDNHAAALAALNAILDEVQASPEYREGILTSHKVGSLRSLTVEQLHAAIDAAKQYVPAEAGDAKEPDVTDDDAPADADMLPCSQVQVDVFKQYIGVLVPTFPDLRGTVKTQLDRLVAEGKIAEPKASLLTMRGMNELLTDLKKGDATLTRFKQYIEIPF